MNMGHSDGSGSSPISSAPGSSAEGSSATSERQPLNPSAIDSFVEGQVTGSAGTGSAGTGSGQARPTDRSAILGQDGRWAAGWALRFIIICAAAYIAWQLLGFIWVGLFPVFMALLVSSVLWPVTRWMRNRKVPGSLASIVTILGTLAIIAGIIGAIAPTVTSQSQTLVGQAREGFDSLLAWLENGPLDIDTSQVDQAMEEITGFLQKRSQQIATGVATGVSTATSAVVNTLMTLVLTFFFLKDGDRFLPGVRSFTGANTGSHLTELFSRIWNTLAGYIRAQAAVSLVDAVFIGGGLIILHVPMALALAVITFIAGFIPIVGAVTAGALAVVIALVTNGVTNALLVLGLIILVQQLEGNVLSPMLQSKAMDLHPAIVLLSVAVGSTLFGIVGAFLAVPVAATIAVAMRYHSETVGLRAGEITVSDMDLATTRSNAKPFDELKSRLTGMSVKKTGNTSRGITSEDARDAHRAAKEDAEAVKKADSEAEKKLAPGSGVKDELDD